MMVKRLKALKPLGLNKMSIV